MLSDLNIIVKRRTKKRANSAHCRLFNVLGPPPVATPERCSHATPGEPCNLLKPLIHLPRFSHTHEVFMYRDLALPLLVVGVMGCTSVQYNEVDCGTLPSDTFWSGNIALQCQEYRRLQAETAYRAEVAQSLRSYRECLSKHEGSLTGAKEQCSVYTQGLRDSPGASPPTK
jgi:hypothetical protein